MRSLFLLLLLNTVYSSCQISQSAVNESVISEIKSVHIVPAGATDPSQIVIAGQVTLGEEEPMVFGGIALYQEGAIISGTQSDFDGNYSLNITQTSDMVSYTVEFSYLGYQTIALGDLPFTKGDSCYIEAVLREEGITICGFRLPQYTVPVYQQDNLTSGQTFDSDQIRHSPTRGK